jgi:hypothetical protein
MKRVVVSFAGDGDKLVGLGTGLTGRKAQALHALGMADKRARQ